MDKQIYLNILRFAKKDCSKNGLACGKINRTGQCSQMRGQRTAAAHPYLNKTYLLKNHNICRSHQYTLATQRFNIICKDDSKNSGLLLTHTNEVVTFKTELQISTIEKDVFSFCQISFSENVKLDYFNKNSKVNKIFIQYFCNTTLFQYNVLFLCYQTEMCIHLKYYKEKVFCGN